MKTGMEMKSIKVKEKTYRQLKLLAAKHGDPLWLTVEEATKLLKAVRVPMNGKAKVKQ